MELEHRAQEAPMATRVRFKAEHIWQAPDDDKRYEVIDGELYVSPAPSLDHQDALFRLAVRLFNWVDPRRLGQVFVAPLGVVLDSENGVEPDLIFVSHARRAIISERGIEGPPDLVVEVLSPSTEARDRGLKMARYGAAGIPHYWLLDPRVRTLEAYRLAEEGDELVGAYGPASTFRPELFPGLEITLAEL
jgi:Uma2 family endonuclease